MLVRNCIARAGTGGLGPQLPHYTGLVRATELVTAFKPLEAMLLEKVATGLVVARLREPTHHRVTGLLDR